MREGLPEGWEEVCLNDVLKSISNGTITPQNKENKGYKVTRIETISEAIINLKRTNYVELTQSQYNKFKLNDGDILFSHINSTKHIGKTAIYESDMGTLIHGMNLLRLVPQIDLIHPMFLLFIFKNKYTLSFFQTRCKKSVNQSSLDQKIIKNFNFILPPLPVQKKIAGILKKAGKLKMWRAEADKLTDEFLKSRFLDMFGDPVKNPMGWDVKKLSNIAEIVSGVTKGRKLSGKSVVSIPYLRVANVQDGFLDLNEIKTIDVLPNDIEKFALFDGDILLTEGGDPDKLGRGAVWHNEIPKCIHQNHIFRVRADKNYLNPEYLSMLIASPHGKKYFLKSAKQTTGIASINSTQLKKFPVLIPPLPLQQKFAAIVRQVEQMRQYQQESKGHIDDLFNALMQKAFKGELVA